MRLTNEDLKHLFKFGMGMQRLDEDGSHPVRGIAEPHGENREWISLWITDGANTVLPRDVEHDGIGGYLFTDPWGGRRRLFPLPEAERVSFGSGKEGSNAARDHHATSDEKPSPGPQVMPGATAIQETASSTEMKYFLVHYARDGYPLGVWRSPSEYFYGSDAQDKISTGKEAVESWDGTGSWAEWIDSIAWNPPDSMNRWDMFKSDEPVVLEELLAQLRGTQTV